MRAPDSLRHRPAAARGSIARANANAHPLLHLLTVVIGGMSLLAATGGCRSSVWLERDVVETPDAWTQYGGDAARSQSVDIALSPPLNVVWTRSLTGGQGPGSPISSAGTLVIPSVSGAIDLLDAQSGDIVGGVPFKGIMEGTPVLADSLLAMSFSFGDAQLAVLDLRTQDILWQSTPGAIDAPLLRAGARIVAVTRDGRVLCTSLTDSALVWEARASSGIRAAATLADSLVIVTDLAGDITARTLARGEQRWRISTGAAFTSCAAAGKGMVYAVNRGGRLLALRTTDGVTVWTADLAALTHVPPAVARDVVVVAAADGIIHAFDAQTGAVRWTHALGTLPGAAPLLARSHIVVVTRNGRLVLLDRGTGAAVWSTETHRMISTSPIIVHNRIILTDTRNGAVAFGSEGGK